MDSYKNIKIEQTKNVLTLWLNRPNKHNAINLDMMLEIIHFLHEVEKDESIRVIVIRGNGKSFCAGADLNWMKEASQLNDDENLEDSQLLTDFFEKIYHSNKITIAITHGNVFGGGNGLAAACDISYGLINTKFLLSETKLGLIAATITKYMLNRVQPSVYKELIFTARPFYGDEAEKNGLLNKSFTTIGNLDNYLNQTINQILESSQKSLSGSKHLINNINDKSDPTLTNIPKILADIRTSDEAIEGIKAFLEKRKPQW